MLFNITHCKALINKSVNQSTKTVKSYTADGKGFSVLNVYSTGLPVVAYCRKIHNNSIDNNKSDSLSDYCTILFISQIGMLILIRKLRL